VRFFWKNTIDPFIIILSVFTFVISSIRTPATYNTIETRYNIMKGTEYFVSLQTSVVVTEKYNVVVNSEKQIGNTEYLTV
jgi:cellobiose-specific phosphotransferase system component IIC